MGKAGPTLLSTDMMYSSRGPVNTITLPSGSYVQNTYGFRGRRAAP